jgi:hypothetical protein
MASPQPPSILLRNRENQRASRARRKDYIEDLERRVRQFERDGAAATVEVQSAARKVAEENFWLRSLLSQSGVGKDEVDDYVERNRMHTTQPVPSVKLLPVQRKRKHSEMSARELEAAITLGEIDSPKHLLMIPPYENLQSPKAMREVFRDLPTPEDSNGSEQEHATSPELPNFQDPHFQSGNQYQHGTESGSGIGNCTSHNSRQADVTPCEEAAHIIASMRGHEDADSVWSELGCPPNQRCLVKNMTIFQLGDVER